MFVFRLHGVKLINCFFCLLQGYNDEHQSSILLILSSVRDSSSLCHRTGVFGSEPRIASAGSASAGQALLLQCSEEESCICELKPKVIAIS